MSENPLRERLAAASARHEPADLVDRVVAGARRRRRNQAAVAGTTAAVAVVVTTVLVAGSRSGPAPVSALRPSPTPTQAHAGVDDAAFRVAPPALGGVGGPMGQEHGACRPQQITATARMRVSTYGVDGVVVMHGHQCSLHVWPGPTALLDSRKHLVARTFDGLVGHVNPPANVRPDLALGAGEAQWGFAWRGSWCGAPASYVVLPLRDRPESVHQGSYGELVVPVTGDQLACHESSNAVLVPGVAGGLQTSVLPPPGQWAPLRLSLRMPARSTYNVITDIVLRISNPSQQEIALDPCPRLALVTAVHSSNGDEFDSSDIDLPCDQNPVVPANGSVEFRLPDQHYDEGAPPGKQAPAGARVAVSVSLAYHPTVTAHAGVVRG